MRENSNVHQSRSQNASGVLRGVTGEDGKLGCLCVRQALVLCPFIWVCGQCYGCLLSYY